MKIIGVIMTYNCEQYVQNAIDQIPKNKFDELICTDDGSRDQTIEIIKKNNIVKIKDSNTLAGSAINMYQTFKNLIQMSFSYEEAVEMTSYNAAKYLNLNNVGLIKENKISNFIVLDNNLNLVDIYFNGKKING